MLINKSSGHALHRMGTLSLMQSRKSREGCGFHMCPCHSLSSLWGLVLQCRPSGKALPGISSLVLNSATRTSAGASEAQCQDPALAAWAVFKALPLLEGCVGVGSGSPSLWGAVGICSLFLLLLLGDSPTRGQPFTFLSKVAASFGGNLA